MYSGCTWVWTWSVGTDRGNGERADRIMGREIERDREIERLGDTETDK